jgi:sugar (pentulose or hexulose) kinase
LWDPTARAALVGLSLWTRPAEIYRALIDALAVAALAIAERLPPPKVWRVSGGGCHNAAWLQATCDAIGEPLEVVADAGEAVGPAVLALRALGLGPPARPGKWIDPDAERGRRLRALYARHQDLNERLRMLAAETGS